MRRRSEKEKVSSAKLKVFPEIRLPNRIAYSAMIRRVRNDSGANSSSQFLVLPFSWRVDSGGACGYFSTLHGSGGFDNFTD